VPLEIRSGAGFSLRLQAEEGVEKVQNLTLTSLCENGDGGRFLRSRFGCRALHNQRLNGQCRWFSRSVRLNRSLRSRLIVGVISIMSRDQRERSNAAIFTQTLTGAAPWPILLNFIGASRSRGRKVGVIRSGLNNE
jgi:hypothetical protein